jgi:hypothetical protein
MVDENISPDAPPAPPPDRLPLAPLFFCISAAPVAWTILHLVAYPLASYACYPKTMQRIHPLPDWTWVRPAMIGLSAAMLILALAGGWTSWRYLQKAKQVSCAETQSPLEGAGRSRYFAMSGLIATVLFVAAIVADAIMLMGAPLCRD